MCVIEGAASDVIRDEAPYQTGQKMYINPNVFYFVVGKGDQRSGAYY